MKPTKHSRSKPTLPSHWVLLALIIITVAIIRFFLLDVPLNRDEGEYAYAGQLILQGIPPYELAYNMKMPGTYAAYALIMSVFGQTPVGIHAGLLIVNATTILLIFLLGKRIYSAFAGTTAAAAFAMLSLGQPFKGMFAYAEHFVILAALGGILLLVSAAESNKRSTLLAGSLLLGIAFLLKQHGVAFIAFGGAYLLVSEFRRKPFQWNLLLSNGLVFLAGALLPFVLTCLMLLKAGVFDKFWFWTFDYASQYVTSMPWATGVKNLYELISAATDSALLILVMAAIGLFSVAWSKTSRKGILFSLLLVVFSCLAVMPGFYFRPHYFVMLLPALALLTGTGANALYELFSNSEKLQAVRAVPLVIVVAFLLHSAWVQRDYLFFMQPDEVSRATFGLNPFPESPHVARFLRESTDKDDRIAIVGSEPQIYFYANRLSATGHVLTYAMMETHPFALSMQEEMISQIEQAKPEYMVFVNIRTSWLIKRESNRMIHQWFNGYSKQNYDLIGVVDIDEDETRYIWHEDLASYKIKSNAWMAIYSKKGH